MPDLEGDLSALRKKVHGQLQPPPIDEVIDRANRRTNRHRVQLITVLAVVLVTAVVPLLQLGVQRGPATTFTTSSDVAAVSIDFYSYTRGYALGRSCRSRSCPPWILATTDGQTWEKRTAPLGLELNGLGENERLTALGSEGVVIEDNTKRYYSGDGARTWREVLRQTDTTIGEIPKEGIIEVVRAPSGGPRCRDDNVSVLLPGSGRSARLVAQPPIKLTWCQSYPRFTGTVWVSGLDPATSRPAVAASRDHGRTWQTTPLPEFTGPASQHRGDPVVIVTESPTTSYAVVLSPGEVTNGLIAIFRSTDLGVTWEKTWQAENGKQPDAFVGQQPEAFVGEPVIGVDGKIRIGQSISADGGRTFLPRSEAPSASSLQWTHSGYLATLHDSAMTGTYYLSTDGINWHQYILPLPKN